MTLNASNRFSEIGKRVLIILLALTAGLSDSGAGQRRKRLEPRPPIGDNLVICTGVTAERSELRVGEKTELYANASDPDGDVLKYKWLATGGTIIADGAKAVFDATGIAEGSYTITVLVTDCANCEGRHPVECSITIH